MMRNITLSMTLAAVLAILPGTAFGEDVTNRITVTVRGNGPDVIVIPGLACSIAVWDSAVARLEAGHRLHLVQVAGFAGSPSRANAGGAVIQPTVDAIDAYIRTAKLKKPKVIGHSLGGLMAMMLASQHPEDTGNIMIVDSLPFFGVVFGMLDSEAAKIPAAAFRDRILGQSQEEYAAGQKQFLPSLVKSPEGRKLVIKWAIDSDKSVVARAMYEDMTIDLRPKLKDISVAVMVVYSWDPSSGFDKSATDSLYQDSYSSVADKKLIRVDDALHFIMLDQPEAFEAQLAAFLK